MGSRESSAIALPRPVVEPPPIATAQSAPTRRASSRASRADSIGTCITAFGKTPAARAPSIAATRSAESTCSGVDRISARLAPRRSISRSRYFRLPAPKTTRGTRNSRSNGCIAITPSTAARSRARRAGKGSGSVASASVPHVPRWNLGVDVDPNALDLRVLAHRLEAHFAAVARQADTAERRRGADALVRVDPHHAGMQVARDAVGALQVGRPQPAAEAVVGAVGDGERLVIVLERQHRDERAEHFFL